MTEPTLPKNYDPQSIEERWYDMWDQSGHFACDPSSSNMPYTIMMPPPNVTGSLHMGHALTFTLQDLLIRYHRMTGRDTLWQPGTDHAGIATQMVVERKLANENVNRRDLGRDGFIDKVWEWKAESGGMIQNQLKRLGASPDWARERFTMDDGLSEAVIKSFVSLHRAGLIYRDKRLVNWDPKLMTAISDLEVEQREGENPMWHLRYRIEGSVDEYISIATTRPETMLGDGAVAVHPDDERYKHLVGKMCILPLSNRPIPIIADEYPDMEKGSGAVKITPAHDFNDFEVGRRHGLPLINLMTAEAKMEAIPEIPEKYQGLDRYEARKQILADLDSEGMVVGVETVANSVPHGDRSGVVIEPWLMDQWYVNAKELAKPAIKAVEDGRTKFVPERWNKTYFEWMRNIQPWCISRQLWWGHRIPAWYGPDGHPFVEENEAAAYESAKAHYGKDVELNRDEDVLDTWFSSGLWPFSTLGWPEDNDIVKRYYPGDVLVTGFDIIFFWVARMMMMSMHFMDGEVPFREVYIHALVRDEKGQKMSKSKGNVIDPLGIIDQYGADPLRFTLAAMAAQGRDIKMSIPRLEGYRNFATKIWNACRFLEMNGCIIDNDIKVEHAKESINIWIITEFNNTVEKTAKAIEAYRFNEAAEALYQFMWHSYCDWYVELIKPTLMHSKDNSETTDDEATLETKATASAILAGTLRLLHPFMPYLTEELNEKIFNSKDMLIGETWPKPFDIAANDAVDEVQFIISLISEIRHIRTEMNVPLSAKPILLVNGATALQTRAIANQQAALLRIARLETVTTSGDFGSGCAQGLVDGLDIALPLADILDLEAEVGRLNKEITAVTNEIEKIARKLDNPGFIAKAPDDVIVENRRRLDEENVKRDGLKVALSRLG
ncbi:valine--tRNA ligase [uncultured Candidatus Puniceispirillum sp.]|uniref:valine--tRNA ligase n=1 Tax=uncultured Candidatus Puniceispirillum sp. TaxID=1985115 RepID=UPI0032B2025C